jgi:hypothetical protein
MFSFLRFIDADAAHITLQGSNLQFYYGDDILNVASGSLGLQGSWVDVDWSTEMDEGTLEIAGSDAGFTLNNVISVGVGALTLAGSTVTFDRTYGTVFNSGSLVLQGQDSQFAIVPSLDHVAVDAASLTLQGSTITCGIAASVSQAAVTIQGRPITLPTSYITNVTPGALLIQGQDITFQQQGTFVCNVTAAQISIDGQILTQQIGDRSDNYGKIDGSYSYVLNTNNQAVLMYPHNGGYYVIHGA